MGRYGYVPSARQRSLHISHEPYRVAYLILSVHHDPVETLYHVWRATTIYSCLSELALTCTHKQRPHTRIPVWTLWSLISIPRRLFH